MQQWNEFIELMTANPLNALFLILGIILLEVILSFDNAAVLATMVKDLSPEDQSKALRYGILGAYLFRGIALILVDVILNIWWLKPIGGLYLIWMAAQHFRKSNEPEPSEEMPEAKKNTIYKYTVGLIGVFWSTVLAVEFMDIVFSIDNIFAVVAYSDNLILICIGVFIGILAMRYVAKYFVVLMEKYPFLENSAFIVIGLLGVKLCFSILVHVGESDFQQGKLEIQRFSDHRVIAVVDLKKGDQSYVKHGNLVVKPKVKLKPKTTYEIVFNSDSKSLNDVKAYYLGEDQKWTFTTGKGVKKKKMNALSPIYPLDNSMQNSQQLTIKIKGENPFKWIDSEAFDLFVSIITLLIFIVPIVAIRLVKKK